MIFLECKCLPYLNILTVYLWKIQMLNLTMRERIWIIGILRILNISPKEKLQTFSLFWFKIQLTNNLFDELSRIKYQNVLNFEAAIKIKINQNCIMLLFNIQSNRPASLFTTSYFIGRKWNINYSFAMRKVICERLISAKHVNNYFTWNIYFLQ